MTITIEDNIQTTLPVDGFVQRPYKGTYNTTQGEANPGSIVSAVVDDNVVTASITYEDSRQEDVRLTGRLSSGNASMHVVGGTFMDVVKANLAKATIKRFY